MFINKHWSSHKGDKKWLRRINRTVVGFPRFSHFFPFLLYIVFIFAMLVITFRTLSKHRPGFYGDEVDKHRKYESPKQQSAEMLKNLQQNRSVDTQLIVVAFKSADSDSDSMLSSNELAFFINQNIIKHVRMAKHTNHKLFISVDVDPKDGVLSWNEYHAYFLKKNGGITDEHATTSHNEKKQSMLSRKMKDTIAKNAKDKTVWVEAAKYDGDTLTLTEEEFLLFRHPEASPLRLSETVDDMMKQLDIDGDFLLSLEEFVEALPNDANVARLPSASAKERKDEFQRFVDVNGNGHASKDELLQYIDPRNYRHATMEATNLFNIADTNNDGLLSAQEVFNKFEVFLASKMIRALENLHEEF